MAIHPNPNSQARLSNFSKMPFKLSQRISTSIILSGPNTGEKSTFSTLDAIQGYVEVAVKTPTVISNIEVALVGNVTTFVDAAGRSGALVGGESQATQQFIKLMQPVELEDFGMQEGLLMDGTYKIPFTFVIPQQLLPRACSHTIRSMAVKNTHLSLPPTMGDTPTAFGFMTNPDFAPEGVKIEYAISANVLEDSRSLSRTTKKVRIVPAVEEEPPLSIDNIDSPYQLRREKTIKKSLFSSKTGTLALSAQEPSSFRLPAPDSTDYDPTTFIRLNLRFDPARKDDMPPPLSSLSSKLLITTSWATTARSSIPLQLRGKSDAIYRDVTSDVLTDEISLSPLTLNTTSSQWIQQLPADPRSSVISTASSVMSETTVKAKEHVIIPPTKSFNSSLPFYTASFTLPLSLPLAKHVWLPTFHSCLVSRTYALALTVHSSSKMELIVPVQMSQKNTARGQAAIDLADAQAQAAFDAEEAFIARSTLAVQPAHQEMPSDISRVGFPSVIGAVPLGNSMANEMPPDYVGVSSWGGGRVLMERNARF